VDLVEIEWHQKSLSSPEASLQVRCRQLPSPSHSLLKILEAQNAPFFIFDKSDKIKLNL